MVDRQVIRYACRCGREGWYGIESMDWILKPLFGKKKGPLECLRCQQTICQNCRKGKYCEFCSDKVPSHLERLHSLITFMNFILIVPLFLAVLAIMFKIAEEGPFTLGMFEMIIIALVILFRVLMVVNVNSIQKSILETPQSQNE